LLERANADGVVFDPDEPPRPGSVEETRAFAAYCVGWGTPAGG
jgi:hypothetical protein